MLRLTSKSLATYKRRAPGAVAQMGERCNRTAEVRGSIPLGSTNSSIWPDAASVTAHSGGQIGPLHAASAPLAADAGEWPPGACAGAHHAQRLPGIFSAQAFIAGFAAAPRCMARSGRDRGEIGARSGGEIRGKIRGKIRATEPRIRILQPRASACLLRTAILRTAMSPASKSTPHAADW
jgi:hypothetical protein